MGLRKLIQFNKELYDYHLKIINGEIKDEFSHIETLEDHRRAMDYHLKSIEKIEKLLKKSDGKRPKPLRPTNPAKKDEEKLKYLVYDLETEKWTKFLCMGFYDINREHYSFHDSLEESLNALFAYAKEHKIKDVYAHNGGKFDIMFMIEAMMRNQNLNMFELTTAIPSGSRLFLTKIKSLRHNHTLNFRDSISFIPMSLDKAGKAYQVETPKETMDFKYIGRAFRNEYYVASLFEDTFIDGKGETRKRNTVFYKGVKVETFKDLMNKSKSYNPKEKYITYFSNEDKKEFRIFNREDVEHYLKVDNICLAQVIKRHFESPIIADAGIAYTVAGQAVKVFQRYLNYTIQPSTDEEDEFVRKAYMGGRTEVFKFVFNGDYDCEENPDDLIPESLEVIKKQQGKKIFCYDANSLYPTVMAKHEYPMKYLGIKKGRKEYNEYEYGVWRVKVKVPEDLVIPPLGINHIYENGSSKFTFPVGIFEGYWTKFELEYAKTLGVEILEYYEGAVYGSSKPLFRNFITEMYGRRLIAKRTKDTTTAEITKLMMNSCYGKLGMSKEDKEYYTVDMGICGQKEVHLNSGDGGSLVLTKLPSDTSKMFSKVILATYVTSYARVYMHKHMMKVGPENVYYTDTDSIFTTEQMVEGDDLGEMKLEYMASSACFLAPKSYTIQGIIDQAYEHKIVLKGFDKFKREYIDPRELFEYHLGIKTEIKAFDPEKFMSFGSAFAHNVALGLIRSEESEAEIIRTAIAKYENELGRAIKKGDKKKINSLKNKIKTKQERLEIVKKPSYKTLKVKYDKRIQCPDKINTVPIKLM